MFMSYFQRSFLCNISHAEVFLVVPRVHYFIQDRDTSKMMRHASHLSTWDIHLIYDKNKSNSFFNFNMCWHVLAKEHLKTLEVEVHIFCTPFNRVQVNLKSSSKPATDNIYDCWSMHRCTYNVITRLWRQSWRSPRAGWRFTVYFQNVYISC